MKNLGVKIFLILAILFTISIISCKKEGGIIQQLAEQSPLEKVLLFFDAKEAKVCFEDLTINEANWYIEAALNYEYGKNHEFYQVNKLDSIAIDYCLNENDLVEDDLLFQIYDDLSSLINSLKKEFRTEQNFNITFIDLEPETENNQFKLYIAYSYGVDNKLCGTTGPYFGSDQYWHYDDGGKCGDYSGCIGTGAAEIFEVYLNGMYGTYPAGCWFSNVDWTTLAPSTSQDYPMFADFDPCLSPSQMNLYFSNTINHAEEKTPSGKSFYYITVHAYEWAPSYYHEAKYRYGTLNYPLELD